MFTHVNGSLALKASVNTDVNKTEPSLENPCNLHILKNQVIWKANCTR